MGKWSKQGCINSAREYNCFKTWIRERKTAYLAARDNEWLDECCTHMTGREQVWTLDKCMASASSYTNRADWRIGDRGAYNEAMVNGWFDRCIEHMKLTNRGYDSKSYAGLALEPEAQKKWLKGDLGAYEAATLDECCKHRSHSFEKWTFEKCKESALKFKKAMEWGANEPEAYSAAELNGWLPLIKKLYYERNSRAWIKKIWGGADA